MVSNQHIRRKKRKKKILDVKLITTNRTTVWGRAGSESYMKRLCQMKLPPNIHLFEMTADLREVQE
jgi:hypothetical protein